MLDDTITTADTTTLAKQLREGRARQGWSLRDAAAKTGISNGYLSLMEHGEVKAPSPRYLRVLADQYVLNYDELMTLAGHSGTSAVSGEAGETTIVRRDSGPGSRGAGWKRAAVFGSAVPAESAATATMGAAPAAAAEDAGALPEDAAVRSMGSRAPEGRVASPRSRASGGERLSALQLDRLDAAERSELTELLLHDLSGLSMQEIAQVRGFIAGLRSARR